MKTFSELAREKMMEFFNNHAHEVGSELRKAQPDKYKDYTPTDCISYCLNVISYAFKAQGNAEVASQVWKLGKRGTDLAKYLVDVQKWKGVYVNPDSIHPADANSEHT